MVGQSVLERFIEAITREKKNNNSSHSAIVSRIDEEGTVWVSVAGSEKETPTASVASEVKRGDAVTVEWRNDRLYIAGNYSDPSASLARVNTIQDLATIAKLDADSAARAVIDLDESLEQEEIIKRITNNYEWQGIYFDENTGDYYINATYIHAGTISADMIKGGTLKVGGTVGGIGGNGVLDIYNSSDARVGRWNANGLSVGSNNEFQVDMSGKITAKNADLTGSVKLSNHSSTVWLDVVVSGSPDGDLGPGMRVNYRPPGDTNIFWGPSLTLTKLSSPDWLFQGKHGKIYDDGDLYLANGKRLYGRNTSPTPTYVPLVYLNANNNFVVGTDAADAFGNMNFYVPSGGRFYFNSNVALASGATVDGVDISDLAPSSVSSVNSSAAVSLANAADTDLINTGSLSAGTYIIKAMASFANNASGRRALFLSTSSGGSVVNRYARVVSAPVNGDATRMQLTYICTITSATTFYLRGYQNSGNSLNVSECGFQILKLHA